MVRKRKHASSSTRQRAGESNADVVADVNQGGPEATVLDENVHIACIVLAVAVVYRAAFERHWEWQTQWVRLHTHARASLRTQHTHTAILHSQCVP